MGECRHASSSMLQVLTRHILRQTTRYAAFPRTFRPSPAPSHPRQTQKGEHRSLAQSPPRAIADAERGHAAAKSWDSEDRLLLLAAGTRGRRSPSTPTPVTAPGTVYLSPPLGNPHSRAVMETSRHESLRRRMTRTLAIRFAPPVPSQGGKTVRRSLAGHRGS